MAAGGAQFLMEPVDWLRPGGLVGGPSRPHWPFSGLTRVGRLAWGCVDAYIAVMGGRAIQSSGPLRYAFVDGMNVRDSRVHKRTQHKVQPCRDAGAVRARSFSFTVSQQPILPPASRADRSLG